MLFLLEAGRVLAGLILGPIFWLARVIGVVLVFLSIVTVVLFRSAPGSVRTALLELLIGVALITIANLAVGFDHAVSRWIGFRQTYFVARHAPGAAVRRSPYGRRFLGLAKR